jgi:hypothetical protein
VVLSCQLLMSVALNRTQCNAIDQRRRVLRCCNREYIVKTWMKCSSPGMGGVVGGTVRDEELVMAPDVQTPAGSRGGNSWGFVGFETCFSAHVPLHPVPMHQPHPAKLLALTQGTISTSHLYLGLGLSRLGVQRLPHLWPKKPCPLEAHESRKPEITCTKFLHAIPSSNDGMGCVC